ncbi:nitroreductase family protein [Sunxiuqinia sp. A32]|uniref:nitroreductase family protein n=1 Tax=Sunxiuqinia sp. A32 TaxID=3461496 RepID=UPI00404566C1
MNRRESLKASASLLGACTVAPFVSSANNFNSEENLTTIFDVIHSRRSVRKFKSDPVPEKHLLKILDAARMAPTAGNQQPWKFLLVQDKKQIEKLKVEILKHRKDYLINKQNISGQELSIKMEQEEKRLLNGYLSAPAYIVVLTDNESQYPGYNKDDGALAAGYLLLAAKALGYGTVYITDAISEEATSKAFNIPEKYKRVCITPVGVPVQWPTKEKKNFEDFIIRESF